MPKESGEGRESALQSGWTVEARSDKLAQTSPAVEPAPVIAPETATEGEVSEQSEPGEAARPEQLSNLTVVMLGLAGGVFMLYAWVWMSWAQYYSVVNTAVAQGSGSIGGFLQQIVYWIAPLAPVLWFASALLMHRRQPKKLALALIIGLIVLLPLPMIFGNGAAL